MKTALVTGASQGLGLSLCTELLKRNYTVIALDCRISNELKALESDSLQIIKCDISNDYDVQNAKEACKVNSLDIIFNNAGIWLEKGRKPLLHPDFEFDTMLRQFNVNAAGMLRIAREFLPLLMAGDSKVMINISSEAGSIGSAERTSEYGYCMSKAAQNMATKLLSNAYSKEGIKLYAIHPGWMQTPMGYDGAERDMSPDQPADDSAAKLVDLAESKSMCYIYYDIDGNELKW